MRCGRGSRGPLARRPRKRAEPAGHRTSSSFSRTRSSTSTITRPGWNCRAGSGSTAQASPSATTTSGRHVPHTGVFDNCDMPYQGALSPEIPTIGDIMREAGYYTAYKGKWHLDPGLSGEERYYDEGMEPYGFSDYNHLGDDHGHELGGFYLDHLWAGDAMSWLRERGMALRREGKPWFLAVNLINPHDIMYFNADAPGESQQDNGRLLVPIERAPDHELYTARYDDPLPPSLLQPSDELGRPRAHYDFVKGYDLMLGHVRETRDHWRRYRDYYYNCLRDVDRQIVRLLDELDGLGLTQDTVVILTSDHGEMCGAHGMRGKGTMAYEDNLHVPLIVVDPAVRGGQECRAVTSHLDLAPTMLAMSGMAKAQRDALTSECPGKDLTRLLADPGGASVDAVRDGALYAFGMLISVDAEFLQQVSDLLAEGKGPDAITAAGLRPDLMKRGHMRTVFDGRYKFSRYFAPRQHNRPTTMEELLLYNDLELFDLQEDPHEMRNLAMDTRANGELILAMNEKLNALIDGEIGEDTGQMLPKEAGMNWAVTEFDP
ncbi:MAG: sulfatase-like hydrolase/transferase [Planctomycetota bacterium]